MVLWYIDMNAKVLEDEVMLKYAKVKSLIKDMNWASECSHYFWNTTYSIRVPRFLAEKHISVWDYSQKVKEILDQEQEWKIDTFLVWMAHYNDILQVFNLIIDWYIPELPLLIKKISDYISQDKFGVFDHTTWLMDIVFSHIIENMKPIAEIKK